MKPLFGNVYCIESLLNARLFFNFPFIRDYLKLQVNFLQCLLYFVLGAHFYLRSLIWHSNRRKKNHFPVAFEEFDC